MGAKTRIDWCDATWNPVTGCLHGCEYCYARGIAHRFGGNGDRETHVVETRQYKDGTWAPNPYPFGFAPTMHKYLLHVPLQWKKQRTIFVCSMADLFGEWVPDEWIEEVFAVCTKAPQHRYLFLTKNPNRYHVLKDMGKLPEDVDCWLGASTPHMSDLYPIGLKTFVSIEPILEPFTEVYSMNCGWVIAGAETGNRKGKVVPKKSWIMPIVWACSANGVPIFMKESLRGIMGDDFRQEFPWEV